MTGEPVKSADDAETRVNLTMPVFVAHDAKRGGGQMAGRKPVPTA